jgi:hypothetical protein
VFWLRRQIKEPPGFLLAQMEDREAKQRAAVQRAGHRLARRARRPLDPDLADRRQAGLAAV